jgi:hypothetical protein
VAALALADLDADGTLDLAVFETFTSGVLDTDDLTDAVGVVTPGNSAGILVFENAWAGPFAAALRRGGARVVDSGRVPVQQLLGALEDEGLGAA